MRILYVLVAEIETTKNRTKNKKVRLRVFFTFVHNWVPLNIPEWISQRILIVAACYCWYHFISIQFIQNDSNETNEYLIDINYLVELIFIKIVVYAWAFEYVYAICIQNICAMKSKIRRRKFSIKMNLGGVTKYFSCSLLFQVHLLYPTWSTGILTNWSKSLLDCHNQIHLIKNEKKTYFKISI